jgi:hypothetical protein
MIFNDQYGLPAITGRIFGWLMVCDPPAQSGASIADAIGASRASIAQDAIKLLGVDGERARRVRLARDVFLWFADVLAAAAPIPRGGEDRE